LLSDAAIAAWLLTNGYGQRRPKATMVAAHNHADVAEELRTAEGGEFMHFFRGPWTGQG
jgi:hypothetical protein